MKKSSIIQEVGLEILTVLDKERKRLKEQMHPMNLQFKEDEHISFTQGALSQAEEIYSKVYSSLNSKYKQVLSEENESNS